MTELERADLFAALAELSSRYPHWRVGQLVANVAGWADDEVWDVEDERLRTAVREHLSLLQSEIANGAAFESLQLNESA